jgi:hypothetical protein
VRYEIQEATAGRHLVLGETTRAAAESDAGNLISRSQPIQMNDAIR